MTGAGMPPKPAIALHWSEGRLHVDGAPAGAWIVLEGIAFAPVEVTADGSTSIALPFAPSREHTFRVGVRAQRDGDALHEGIVALPRVDDTIEALVDAGAHPMEYRVTIVVPVYNAPSAVARCLASVLAHTTGPARLVVIDDASPDPAIAPMLATFEGRDGVEILRNERNRGFTATANRGIAHAGRDDVVLLNADTEVAANWLTGLRRAAWRSADIATATAVSDNAGAFSVPELEQACEGPAHWSFDDTARALWQQAGFVQPELPTGNGFCLYIRRDVIDAIGMLDEQAFPQGYGEENDFCQRASAQGRRHVVAGDVYVHHERSQSFGIERREALGRAGMQVLRERWPDYERDVGAMLFSPVRRVLDWRVRRAFALAGEAPRPRVLAGPGIGGTTGLHEAWQIAPVEHEIVLARHGERCDVVEHAAATDVTSSLLAHWLQRHAFEVLDTASITPPRLASMLAREATRLGIAVATSGDPATRDLAWSDARRAQRSFEGDHP
ncbi:glycosyltransferase family 2 protein [Dokdonella sp. MW10]|uniref:glycosyltransferase family 2 protein n=1 Tax=Dokdonella sp. MW10 TaxID=2992926 RepID=UPI003F7E5F74